MKQNLDIDKNLFNLIKRFEGYSDKAYVDPASGDKPYTIGYGSTRWLNNKPIRLGEFIDIALAEKLLKRDILEVIGDLEDNCPNFNSFNDNQKNALISFSYNTGWYYGKTNYDTLNEGIRNKDLLKISQSFKLYINKDSPAEKGLIVIRKIESELFNKN
jgi:lysozyme